MPTPGGNDGKGDRSYGSLGRSGGEVEMGS